MKANDELRKIVKRYVEVKSRQFEIRSKIVPNPKTINEKEYEELRKLTEEEVFLFSKMSSLSF